MKQNSEDAGKKKEKTVLGEIWEWTYCILLAVAVTLLVKNLVFSTTIVRKESMLNTLQDGNILLVDRLGQVAGKELKRGDIVVLEAPHAKSSDSEFGYYPQENVMDKFVKLFKKLLYIKRVIGLPGERIMIEDGIVYINGNAIEEKYLKEEWVVNNDDIDVEIPEGYVFCMGDNRNASLDSRNLGLIPINRVEGRATFRLFPFDKFGDIK